MQKQLAQQMADQKASGGPMNFKISGGRAVTRTELYQFPTINKMVRKDNLITPYLIEETMPVIAWKISADTATIGTLHCQKATAHFKGRDYTAWFCPDLPFRAGPWKLSGLPGLIVEAYDTNKEVEFKFDGLDQVTPTDPKALAAENNPTPVAGTTTVVRFSGVEEGNKDPNIIALPTNAVKTTEKEFAKLQEAMRKDPQAFMAAMGGNNGNVVAGRPTGGARQITSISINSGGGSAQVINNPLELPEKK